MTPDLIIDMATLTGAARAALGPDVPPFYTRDEAWADLLQEHAIKNFDPLWRMPLWTPYFKMMLSPVADFNNVGGGGFAGSITAALFLEQFIDKAKSWVHLDIYGWNPSTKPYSSVGGEAQAIRTIYNCLKHCYA